MRFWTRAIVSMLLGASAAPVAWSLVPAERWLGSRAVADLEGGCSAGSYYVQWAEDPRLSDRMIAVVHGGPLEDRACENVARVLREEEAWLRLVPRRYLCRRVWEWAGAIANDKRSALQWIVDGEGLSPAEEYAGLTSVGLRMVAHDQLGSVLAPAD